MSFISDWGAGAYREAKEERQLLLATYENYAN